MFASHSRSPGFIPKYQIELGEVIYTVTGLLEDGGKRVDQKFKVVLLYLVS